jgi:molybdopterin converting factor small subunit
MIRVVIPSQLESYTDGVRALEAEGATVAQVLDDLDRRFPGIRFRVIDEQERIRKHMRIFTNGDMTTDIALPVARGDEVLIFGALSGG